MHTVDFDYNNSAYSNISVITTEITWNGHNPIYAMLKLFAYKNDGFNSEFAFNNGIVKDRRVFDSGYNNGSNFRSMKTPI